MTISSKKKKPVSEINVVPYIDVMLVLLVIFMITAPMLTQGVTVDLPQTPSQEIAHEGQEPLIISVDKQGYYYLNTNAVPDQSLTAKELVLKVAAELKLAQQSQQQAKVLVKGDQGVAYGKVVYAMALLKRAGADTVGLVTEQPEDLS